MAVLLLLAVIGAIVYGARTARRECVVSVPVDGRAETWKFNIRDMRGEVVRTASSKVVRSFELRRRDDGRWDMSDDIDDEESEYQTWSACEEYTQEAIESAYRRYEGQSEPQPTIATPYRTAIAPHEPTRRQRSRR